MPTPMIHQAERAECGLACLAMVLAAHGDLRDLRALREHHGGSSNGTSLASLTRIAREAGMVARSLRVEPGELRALRLPCILHWDFDHFIVLVSIGRRRHLVHDPALGVRRISAEDLDRHFTGVAVELSPGPQFQRGDTRTPLRLGHLLPPGAGIPGTLLQAAALSLLSYFSVLASPYFMQLVVDDVLTSGHLDLLRILALGFVLVGLFGVAATALRTHLVNQLGAVLAIRIGGSLMRHLLRLPLRFYTSRHAGDILSRFSAYTEVRRFVAETAPALLIDALLTLVFMIVLLIYQPALAGIVAAAVLIHAGLRAACFPAQQRLAKEQMARGAEASTSVIENLRAMQSIKSFGKEEQRLDTWLGWIAAEINAELSLKRTFVGIDAGRGITSTLEHILVLYLAAQAVFAGTMTVGMIFAFMAYRGQFHDRATALVDHTFALRTLDVHLERLADIANEAPERLDGPPGNPGTGDSTMLVAHDVSYRHPGATAAALAQVSMRVEAGETVAIIGPSGSGKSTLVRLLSGLCEVTGGQLTIVGLDAANAPLHLLRSAVSLVSQDEHLLSGTVVQNVTFFEPAPDHERVVDCLRTVGLLDDLLVLPMRLETLIGDLGSTLSAGQRQRVLIARALYKRPALLILDEATSNLDIESESRIFAELRARRTTLIFVSHRPDLLRLADRVLKLERGQLEAIEPPFAGQAHAN